MPVHAIRARETSLAIGIGVWLAAWGDENHNEQAHGAGPGALGAQTNVGGQANAGGDCGASTGGENGTGGGCGHPSSASGDTPEVAVGASPGADVAELRTRQELVEGWRFIQGDLLSKLEALADWGEAGQRVSLPHTWNVKDGTKLQGGEHERGSGFYRLSFDTPSSGARHFVELGAASRVVEVWLNGEKLGARDGELTTPRFDVTNVLVENGTNELLLEVSGGLFSDASLISTPAAAHFSLGDPRSSGVYANTIAIAGGTARLQVRAEVEGQGEALSELTARVSLIDDAGQVVGAAEAPVQLKGEGAGEVTEELRIARAHLWQGTADPYLYRLVAELVGPNGEPLDRVTERLGICQMRFEAAEGLFLNGQRVRLKGVAVQQEPVSRKWVMAEDVDASLALIREMGANAIRLGHSPLGDYALQRLSELGLLVMRGVGDEALTAQLGCEVPPDSAIPYLEGAGGAISDHTDNPLGGPPESAGAEGGEIALQPEEYQSHLHEQRYRSMSGPAFSPGAFVENMFDLDRRDAGDVLENDTQGLVTHDRRTRKDAFFFYKASWNSEPTTYIASRRYTERAYSVVDVKVYSNADAVELSINGKAVAALTADQCEQRTCVFDDLSLSEGQNTVTVIGDHAGKRVTDTVYWSLGSMDYNIAAGRLATEALSASGKRFGSDDFFTGGDGKYVGLDEEPGAGAPEDLTGTDDPILYEYFRQGIFSYELPLADGDYELTLGFLEPDQDMEVGGRVFDVTANEALLLQDFDVLAEAREARKVITRTFTVNVARGRLVLDFAPTRGEALVSTITVRGAGTAMTRR